MTDRRTATKITPVQAMDALAASGGALKTAARALGVHTDTLTKALQAAGVKSDVMPFTEGDIPPQYRPLYDTVKAKVGKREAVRILKKHIERRG